MFEQSSYLGVATADWVAALKSSDPLERRLAAHALGEIGRTAREAVPALTEALRDPVSFVRVWAAAALARVEPESPDDIPESRLRSGSCASFSTTMIQACTPRRW